MNKFKLAALPLAMAGIVASNSALAGTEACFESYRTVAGGAAAGLVIAHDTLYTPASCDATPTAAGATELQALDNAKIAWELTGDLDIDLEALGAVNPRHHIVYIPTTDIPPASRITMELSGADFGTANANQMYLVHKDGGGDYQTVASSDGAFDNGTTITFLTKAGVTIGAGSRLLLSQLNPTGVAEDGTLIEGIHLHLANTEVCDPSPSVTIAATSAKTDGNTDILGATSDAFEILDVSEQFELVAGADSTNEIEVDAEDPSFRTQFVFEQDAGDWVGKVIAEEAFWEAKFINNHDSLDAAITIAADDDIILGVSATSGTGDGVELSIDIDSTNAADASILDASEADHRDAGATIDKVDINDNTSDMVALTMSNVDYTIDADELFPNDADEIMNVAVILSNDNTPDAQVMEFNYEVNTTWSMDFDDDSYLDKNACETPTPFDVGVNGAVLKVPYTYETSSNWVRITSEHNNEATIFLDIFDESSNEYKNVNLGQIQGKSSVVLTAEDMIAAAKAEGYAGVGERHTMTFTVTAPKNKVHGVSVQKIPGGVDRVLPVLDQNDWRQ